jgi:Fe-S cluster assembly iron-binding protein IscA
MLQLTESAAMTLADTRSQIGVPRHFGLRIFRGVSDGKAAFAFDFVEAPEDGDEVGEVEETRYFVAPEVAAPLADAVLDTEPTAEGPQLTLKRQQQQ